MKRARGAALGAALCALVIVVMLAWYAPCAPPRRERADASAAFPTAATAGGPSAPPGQGAVAANGTQDARDAPAAGSVASTTPPNPIAPVGPSAPETPPAERGPPGAPRPDAPRPAGARRATAPQLSLDAAVPTGRLDASSIRDVVRSHVRELADCATGELERGRADDGRVVLELDIGADGRVASANVTDESVGNETVRSCLERVARSMTFPAPSGGHVRVRYPITLGLSPPQRP